ncbi:MAG: hypothetical protein V4671_30525 [Armatimonadota bacterium]
MESQKRMISRRSAVNSGFALFATLCLGLAGCGGAGSGGMGAVTEENPVPLAGYYEGPYTRSSGETGIAQIRINGLEDRRPATDFYPAIEPGFVQGALIPSFDDGNDLRLLGGNIDRDGKIDLVVNNESSVGFFRYDPETGLLTGTFRLTNPLTGQDTGTISFALPKRVANGSGAAD